MYGMGLIRKREAEMGIAAENAKRELTTDSQNRREMHSQNRGEMHRMRCCSRCYTENTDKKWVLGCNWRRNIGCSAMLDNNKVSNKLSVLDIYTRKVELARPSAKRNDDDAGLDSPAPENGPVGLRFKPSERRGKKCKYRGLEASYRCQSFWRSSCHACLWLGCVFHVSRCSPTFLRNVILIASPPIARTLLARSKKSKM
jgi:hypothetical protein